MSAGAVEPLPASIGSHPMKYRKAFEVVYNQPLAILPGKLQAICSFLHTKAIGEDVPEEQIQAIAASRRANDVQMAGRVAVVPVFGTIMQRVSMLDRASGGISTEELGATLDALAADRQVGSITMVFDSPGGTVQGVTELGKKMRAVRDQKKIVGVADSMAASAAYWLLSQTSEISVTESGQVGSIGVIAQHVDTSKLQEMAGLKTTLVVAGKYKAELSPSAPLSDDARKELQGKVDYYYSRFVEDVAKGRGVTQAKVRSDFGQGRLLMSEDAVRLGMADRIGGLEAVLRRLAGPGSGAVARTAAERLAAGRNESARADTAIAVALAAYRERAWQVEAESERDRKKTDQAPAAVPELALTDGADVADWQHMTPAQRLAAVRERAAFVEREERRR
jgi:signal peptide peptidase SppA